MIRTTLLLASLPLILPTATVGAVVVGASARPASVPAQDEPPSADEGEQDDAADAGPQHFDERSTKGLLGRFERAEHWTMQCLVLLAFGERWHPVGASAFVRALDSREPRLRAYALEGLHRADDACLAWVATPELVEVLMKKSLSDRDDHFHARVLALLARLFPEVDADDKGAWRAYWRDAAEAYEPAPWVAPPPREKSGDTVALAVDRALDLREAGLELCFCIDATGTMGPLIDATAQAAQKVGELLEGFAPELRVGAVIYRDQGDMPGGAKVLAELTKRHDNVFDEIADVRAEGGGDVPEAVGAGIELAVQQDALDWSFPTNKLVIVMGDAPPHPGEVDAAVESARRAHERPLGFEAKSRRSSSGRTVAAAPRPFVVSCIGVGVRSVHSHCQEAFEKIADAGGGAYASLAVDGDEERVRRASREVVRHVLSMSFGERWRDEVGEFLAIYFTYLDHEYFD